jgi:serine O-acetyltransferase
MIYGFFNHTRQLAILVQLGKKIRPFPLFGLFLSTMVEYIIRIVFSSDISCAANISPSVKFVHGHDIVIGSDVVIGENSIIFNGVTLGNKDTAAQENAQPIIEAGCTLSTGAKILGKVTIGRGSIVGANSVVLKDVPPNSIAVGIPARILPRKSSEQS